MGHALGCNISRSCISQQTLHLQNENYYVQLLKFICVRPKIKALKICYLNKWKKKKATTLGALLILLFCFKQLFWRNPLRWWLITKVYCSKIQVQLAVNECRPWQSHVQNLRERIKLDRDRCSVPLGVTVSASFWH